MIRRCPATAQLMVNRCPTDGKPIGHAGCGGEPPWRPQFDALSHKQEVLVQQFCAEIAGPKGERGRNPDPVRLLEMAEALYLAELEDLGGGAAPAIIKLTKADTVALWHAVDAQSYSVRAMRDMNRKDPGQFTPEQIASEQERLLAAKRTLRKVNAIRKAQP